MRTLTQDLIGTRRVLSEGWVQGTYYSPSTGCHCLVGAIRKATGVTVIPLNDYAASYNRMVNATNYLAELIKPAVTLDERTDLFREGTVTLWNDNELRTVSEVLDLVDAAIEKSQQEEA